MAKQSYRELEEQLEAVLAQLQSDTIDVDEALKLHEQGSKLLAALESRLAEAEHHVEALKTKRT
jgi:exodeoxyribonuclease VII small subunit